MVGVRHKIPIQEGPGDEPEPFLPTRVTLLSRLRNLEDQDSWRDFFDTYWKLIYRAALKAGLQDAEAQDVVQETILTITRTIQAFRYDPEVGTFKGWLLRTTRWRVLDHLRRRNREVASKQAHDPRVAPEDINSIPDPAVAGLQALWDAEWQQNLMDAAIERIKKRVQPKHFQAFELCALKEWPPGEAAQTLGMNVAHVHLVKHRVGKLVQKELKRLENEGV